MQRVPTRPAGEEKDSLDHLAAADTDLLACVRDLVALSAMPSSWTGRSLRAIAWSARDLLVDMLRVEAAYVQVRHPTSDRHLVAVTGRTRREIESALPRATKGRVLIPPPGHGELPLHLAAAPIGAEGELGWLAAGDPRPDFPNHAEALLLRVMANQVAVAVRHTGLVIRHLEGEQLLGARAAQQLAVAELGMRALTGISLGELLDAALSVIRDTLHVDFGEVLELAPDGQSLLLTAGVGWGPGVIGHARVSSSRDSQAGYTLLIKEPVVVADLRHEPRFTAPQILADHGVLSGMTVIIHDTDRPFGVLGAHSRAPRGFTSDDVHFLQSIGNLLAAALQRHEAESMREDLLRQMRRAVAARDRAVGVVSHDLGNPLSTIQICATALLDPEPPSVNGIREMAGIIQRAAAWMQQIVQDLLDRTSLDAGRLVLERQPTAVSDLVGAARAVFAPVADDQGLELVVDVASDLPRMDADPNRLLQVLSNLLGNALKFTPAGGRVGLIARMADEAEVVATGPDGSGGAVRFAVSDTGPGIPPEDVAHVTDWFWHAERTGRRGTGLGLAIAKGLIEAHRGRLHVESVPGEGSTFWFTIPAVGS